MDLLLWKINMSCFIEESDQIFLLCHLISHRPDRLLSHLDTCTRITKRKHGVPGPQSPLLTFGNITAITGRTIGKPDHPIQRYLKYPRVRIEKGGTVGNISAITGRTIGKHDHPVQKYLKCSNIIIIIILGHFKYFWMGNLVFPVVLTVMADIFPNVPAFSILILGHFKYLWPLPWVFLYSNCPDRNGRNFPIRPGQIYIFHIISTYYGGHYKWISKRPLWLNQQKRCIKPNTLQIENTMNSTIKTW